MVTTILASVLLAQSGAAAAPAELTIGDTAPVPQIEHWVRGKEPTFFEPGKVYVVEFWATWCGPCRTSMPHLSDLSEKYADKGVVIVGVSDEPPATVTAFLDKDEWKQKARYTLATDPDKSTHNAYMEAAAQGGIPTAFIVKDGTVQWIGHPMGMDAPLEKIVGGTWDTAEFKKTFLPEQREQRAAMARRRAMAEARKSGDWDRMLAMLDADIAATEGDARRSIEMQKFSVLLMEANRPEPAYALGRELVAAFHDTPQALNQIAWTVLDSPKVKVRDLDFALATAQAAVTASKGKDPSILDTLARAYWETGDKSLAVKTQKQAVELADENSAAELQSTLEKYEGGTPPKPTAGNAS